MKTFKKILSEVAEPVPGDEINFKKKHLIQRFYDPAGNDDAFTGNVNRDPEKFKNLADYDVVNDEDEDVYESVDVNEDTMPGNVAHNLADRHFTAAFAHKKAGNMKGYAAHVNHAEAITDAIVRAGSHMPVRSKRLVAKSDSIWAAHPVKKTVSESTTDMKKHHNDSANRHMESVRMYSNGTPQKSAHMRAATAHRIALDAVGTDDEVAFAAKADMATKAARRIEKDLPEAHSHPLYDMYGAEDDDINNDGIVDERDVAMKRARNQLIKKRYHLEDVATDSTHKINHDSKLKYRDINAKKLPPHHEVEKIVENDQLDELSKDTLISYMKKAGKDRSDTAKGMDDEDYHKMDRARETGTTYRSPMADRFNKRTKGVDKAFNKFDAKRRVNEDAEQLDELSKKTLRSYGSKAIRGVGDEDDKISSKRAAGVNMASAKLYPSQYKNSPLRARIDATESVESEQLDELSKKTLGSYIKKASGQLPAAGKDSYTTNYATRQRALSDVNRRTKGISTAVDKLSEDGAAYAIGMKKAKEIHDDEPPLRKKTIKTAHKIAKSILGEAEEMNETHLWYDVGHWKDGSHHFDNLDDLAPDVKHAANSNGSDAKRPDSHVGIPVSNKKAIAYMDKHAPLLHESAEHLDEAMKLDKVNHVHHDAASEKFAKEYVKAKKGDYDPSGGTEKHAMDNEKFHDTYDYKHTRSGFAGSGTTVYTHKTTGAKFEVDRNPNGKGFYGTDHHVKKLNEETDQLDELSKKTLGSYIKKASDASSFHNSLALAKSIESRGNGYSPKDDIQKAMKRRTGLSKAVDKLSEDLIENYSAGSIKLNDGKAVTLSASDAKLLNQLFTDLNSANRKKMESALMGDKTGFEEILGFAREAL